MRLQAGTYVLATKFSDGDSKDQWFVGFYDGKLGDKHFVKDANGVQSRLNGYRRVQRITKAEGKYILANKRDIERGNLSMWQILRQFRLKALAEDEKTK